MTPRRTEVRLVPMKFNPAATGGRWVPAVPESLHPWADAWEAGITEEEARQALFDVAAVNSFKVDPGTRKPLIAKLRAAFKESSHA